ncbi:MAG TPA: ABC transporter permease [Micromonosporaceae bacterium]|nr:ABC transporter permease [Micromonosporaceae bacterium]
MTIALFVRRFLTDYARNRVNLTLLIVVPVIFVGVVGAVMSNATQQIEGGGGAAIETASPAWAAAFIAGIGMYFQTAATRDIDQRMVIAGLPPARLVAARLLTGLALALLASTAALITLAVRTGIDSPARVAAGTLMAAIIYVAIGAAVGSFVHNAVNGTVLLLLIWIVDLFFGPALGAADRLATRWLPIHYVTLWMIDLPGGRGGRAADLGWALAWTGAAILVAWTLTTARTRSGRRAAPRLPAGSVTAQLVAAGQAVWRDARRNPALWALFVAVPAIFILASHAAIPDTPLPVTLHEDGRRFTETFPMSDVHTATLSPVSTASLAALVGLFTVLDSRAGDRRAALAGLRPGVLLAARLGLLAVAALLASAVSLATTASVFDATRWPIYALGNVLIALTYGLIGALLAPLFGRVGGVLMSFLLPFLDVGMAQSPLPRPEPAAWAKLLPAYGGSRTLLDGAFTHRFDEVTPLLVGVAWLVALLVVVAIAYRRTTAPFSPSGHR